MRKAGFIRQESLFLFLLLTAAIFLLYSPALTSPFLFDDINNIEHNRAVQMSELSISSLKKAAHGPRPVAMLSFAFDYYLHGLNPFWFRVTNIFIHIGTAMILYFTLCRTMSLLTEDVEQQEHRWMPALSTLLWAVHPLQIQSVTYIVQRMNSLAGFFLLLSLLLYIHARLTRKILLVIACILAALLAIGSKPNAAMLPLLILLYEYFFFQKKKNKLWRHPFFLTILVSSIVSAGIFGYFFMQGHPMLLLSSWYAKNDFTPVQRVMTEFRVIILYLSLLFFPYPSRLNIDHDILLSRTLIAPPSTALSLAAILFLLTIGWIAINKYPLLSFGIFWFFSNLLIESTIIPLDFIFEHRVYIPSMMLIAGIMFPTGSYRQKRKKGVMCISLLFLMFFSLWTYQRNSVWQSGSALWQDSVNKSPNKPRPHESLAYYLEQAGHLSEALRHYKRAVLLNPKNSDSYNNIGNIYMKEGNVQDAILYYKTALPLQSSCKELCNNIGNALSKLGYLKQALTYYEIALKNDKNYTKAHINFANTLSVLGNTELAMRHYQLAAKLDPENIENNYNRSILLLQKGDFKEASKILEKIVKNNTSFKEAYNNLGVALENLGEIDKAKEKYQQALSIDPTFIDAKQNISRIKNNNLPK